MTKVITTLASLTFLVSSAFGAIEFSEDQVAATAATSASSAPVAAAADSASSATRSSVAFAPLEATSATPVSAGATAMLTSTTTRTPGSIGSSAGVAAGGIGGGGGAIGGASANGNNGVCFCDPLTGATTNSVGEVSDSPVMADAPSADDNTQANAPAATGMPEPSSVIVWGGLLLGFIAYRRRQVG